MSDVATGIPHRGSTPKEYLHDNTFLLFLQLDEGGNAVGTDEGFDVGDDDESTTTNVRSASHLAALFGW